MPTQRAQDTSSPINAPDYDLFDLIATASASGTPPTPGTPNPTVTNVAPLTYEGAVYSAVPAYVVCTDNFVLSLENWNIANNTADAAVVYIQQFFYSASASTFPYGIAGPVIYVADIAAAVSADSDRTKTRLTCPPGFFLAMFVAGTFSTDFVTLTARARHTQG